MTALEREKMELTIDERENTPVCKRFFSFLIRNKRDKNIKVLHQGDVISFTGRNYGSVGYQYQVEFNRDAFKEDIQTRDLYKHREEDYVYDKHTGTIRFIRPCGGDEMEVTYRLTAIKKGVYEIREITDFRGDIESEIVHKIRVK